jgi:hypothetical protein
MPGTSLNKSGHDGGGFGSTISEKRSGIPAEHMSKLFSGAFPGILDHSEQIRRHGPWPRHQPPLLSDDGWRHHGRKRDWPRLNLHDPATEDCGRSEGSGGCQSGSYRRGSTKASLVRNTQLSVPAARGDSGRHDSATRVRAVLLYPSSPTAAVSNCRILLSKIFRSSRNLVVHCCSVLIWSSCSF